MVWSAVGWWFGASLFLGDGEAQVDFARDVQPILSRCYACHGPDAEHRAAHLRLDRRDDALAPRRHPALVPGDVDASGLLTRVTSDDARRRMPPPSAGAPLDEAEVDILRRWIEQGAEYADHWAFRPMKTRPVPPGQWGRSPLDRWVDHARVQQGLAPSPPADRATWLRRVTLDLTGLPPTPEARRAFQEDDRPGARERVVDRLLASPRYGERWARMWLDLARYADSAGYGSDPLRVIWRYRDWVIDAYNENMPYDQFSIEQLAGDLLPGATTNQRLATAFHRNTMTNTEGGTDDEEFRVAAVKDRAITTGHVWMGLTFGCAQCHTHKFDPIEHDDFYRLYAFFDQTEDADRNDEAPRIPTPTPDDDAARKALLAEVERLESALEAPVDGVDDGQRDWERRQRKEAAWTTWDGTWSSREGATFHRAEDKSWVVGGTEAPADIYAGQRASEPERQALTAVRVQALADDGGAGPGRSGHGNFVLSELSLDVQPKTDRPPEARFVQVWLPGPERMLSLAEVQVFAGEENVALTGRATQSSTGFDGPAHHANDGNTDGQFASRSVTHTVSESDPWWEVDLGTMRPIDRVVLFNRTDGSLHTRLNGCVVALLDEARSLTGAKVFPTAPTVSDAYVPAGQPFSVPFAKATASFEQDGWTASHALDGDRSTGWGVAPRMGESHTAVFAARWPLSSVAGTWSLTLGQEYGQRHTLGRFAVSWTDATPVPGSLSADLRRVLARDESAPRSDDERRALRRAYVAQAPEWASVREELAQLQERLAALTPVTTPVLRELPDDRRRTTRVMIKGNFLVPGDEVAPGVPAVMPAMTSRHGGVADRLDLARWLMRDDHPLTARVAVNRLWAQLFGRGLVETEEDFGTQGTLPTHPELLDWLALRLIELEWDQKAFLRELVLSATYGQASVVTEAHRAKDPTNRWLARGPRVRLEAEMVRDQALALSGLLSSAMHGPSIYPPQPPGMWRAAFNGQRDWKTSKGDDRMRRGLYVFWRRTVPYPSMATFDAPSRETCTVRRIATNTPLQAFVTLNDPAYVEMAQALGRRLLREGGDSVPSRVAFGFELCLGHPPSDDQLAALVGLWEAERETGMDDSEAARSLATDPLGPLPDGMDVAEAAAATVVASVLLNLDAVLVKS